MFAKVGENLKFPTSLIEFRRDSDLREIPKLSILKNNRKLYSGRGNTSFIGKT